MGTYTKKSLFLAGMIVLLYNCTHGSADADTIFINDTLQVAASLVFADDFDSGFENWVPEHEKEMILPSIIKGALVINAPDGSTTWFKEKLTAPVMIEYEAVVIGKGGPNDRVSDLNCFWLATDPGYPNDFFKKSKERKGIFENYDHMQLYYVGLGGHNNTKTRFRRYDGTGEKPLLPEHDLSDEKYLITPNAVNRIRIVVYHGIVQFYRNEQLIFDFFDPHPYSEGYFGIRTVRNHMTVNNFKVYSLSEK